MGSAGILTDGIARLRRADLPQRILELGAGDGTLLLRVARLLPRRPDGVELFLLDQQELVNRATIEAYATIGWKATVVKLDVLDWARDPADSHYDLCVASLFLHHFGADELSVLLRAVAGRVGSIVVCEPRRDAVTRIASRLVGLIGANAVTRADAISSVAAGFAGHELSDLWPAEDRRWILREYRARGFSHCFSAVRASIARTVDGNVARR
jgi:SAM-dependent methyltransferase